MAYRPPVAMVRDNPQAAARVLNQLARTSVDQRRQGLVPALYASGVRYKREPRGVDEWLTAAETYKRGWGDCEDLAVWLVADMLTRGIPAEVVIKKVRPGLSHAMVLIGRSRLEDPSRKLGMTGRG